MGPGTEATFEVRHRIRGGRGRGGAVLRGAPEVRSGAPGVTGPFNELALLTSHQSEGQGSN